MSKWVEPISPCLCIDDDREEFYYEHEWPKIIVLAVKRKLLSATALCAIEGFLRSQRNDDWPNKLITIEDEIFGDNATLFTLSLTLLEQSHHMPHGLFSFVGSAQDLVAINQYYNILQLFNTNNMLIITEKNSIMSASCWR